MIIDSNTVEKSKPKLLKRETSRNFVKDLPNAFQKNFVFKILCEHEQVGICPESGFMI